MNFKRKSKVAETSAVENFASQHWVTHFHNPAYWLLRDGSKQDCKDCFYFQRAVFAAL